MYNVTCNDAREVTLVFISALSPILWTKNVIEIELGASVRPPRLGDDLIE
jgi:hypothetical protein